MKEDAERRLKSEGYTFSLRDDKWSKVVEEGDVGIPGIGTGFYKKVYLVEELDRGDMTVPSLTDAFAMRDRSVMMMRKIKPYPLYQAQTPKGVFTWGEVKIKAWGKTSEKHFGECELNYSRFADDDGTSLQVFNQGFYRASYNKNGDLEWLNVGTPFVSLGFQNGNVEDSNSEPLGKLEKYLNTEKKLHYNERLYIIGKSTIEVTVEELHPIDNQRLFTLSVPTTVSIPNLADILTQETKDWIQLLEHIPVKLEAFPRKA